MPLTPDHRAALRESLGTIAGPEAIDAMLEQFPTDADDQLVTQRVLHVELAQLRGDLQTEMAGLRGELHVEMAHLETRVTDRIGQAATDTRIWIITAMLGGFGLVYLIGLATN